MTRRVINPRIAERRAEVRRERMLRRRRRTCILLVVAAVAAVLYLVERSPLIALEEVRVTGTERLPAETVREAASLDIGTSTLRLRLDAAERRVEALPLVSDAEVRRVDPLTVEVEVTERRPELVLRTGAGPVLVDGTGVVVSRGATEGLPVIVTRASERPRPGDHVPSAATQAHVIWRELPEDIRAATTRYEVVGDDVTLVLGSGVRVRFGRAEDVDEKARALRALLAVADELAVVDVRAPSNPVTLTP